MDRGIADIFDAARAFPKAPRVQLYAAALYLYAQTEEANEKAGMLLAELRSAGADLKLHDAALLEALTDWHCKRYLEALGCLEGITREWPSDLLSLKFSEYLYYVLGQQYLGPRFLQHCERLAIMNHDDPDFLGIYAFANELNGYFDEAERLATRALELEPRNPWAHHALSHVLIRLGRIDEGIRQLESFLPVLETCDRLIHCHDSWHLGLLYLEQMDHCKCSHILQQRVWGITPDLIGEQVDTIALLWRMEMAGFDQTDHWIPVAAHVENRVEETFMPFLQAHFAYALARAGRTDALARLLHASEERAKSNDPEANRVWASVGFPIIQAAAAFGQQRPQDAAMLLDSVMPKMTMVGGSDAQDDLFRQTYYVSLCRSGRRADAANYLDRFLANKIRSPLDDYFAQYAGKV